MYSAACPATEDESAALTNLRSNSWDSTLDALRTIGNLTDDWDGNGAIAPAYGIVETAIAWAHHVAAKNFIPPSSVVAGPNGTILFNWQDENGFVDVEVTRPNYLEWMQIVPGRPTQHGVLDLVNLLGAYPPTDPHGCAEATEPPTIGARSVMGRMTSCGRTLAGTV